MSKRGLRTLLIAFTIGFGLYVGLGYLILNGPVMP